MKLSNETIDVLKSFAAINMSLLIKSGNTIKTVSPQKTILGTASVPDSFPKECAIYDLNEFLSVVQSMKDPDLEFKDKYVNISEETGGNVNYQYASPSTIASPPDKDIKLPSEDVSVEIPQEVFSNAIRMASIMKLSELAIRASKGTATIEALEAKNPERCYSYPIGKSDDNYMVLFKVENMKLLPRDYSVRVSSKGISEFKSKTGDVVYYIPTEVGTSIGK